MNDKENLEEGFEETFDENEVLDEETELEEDSLEEVDEPEEEDEIDESVEESEEQEEEPQEDKVPLKTHLETKKKYRELKKQLQELKEKEQSQDLISYKEQKKKKYIDMGYDAELAEALAEDLAENRGLIGNKKENTEDELILEEIQDLELSGYSDASQYKDKIIDLARKAKKLGEDIDIEDAYLMAKSTTKPTVTRNEIQTRIEQQEAIRRRKSGTVSKKVSSTSSKPKGYGLSSEDMTLLKQLKKDYPDAGWTPKKLSEMIKNNNI